MWYKLDNINRLLNCIICYQLRYILPLCIFGSFRPDKISTKTRYYAFGQFENFQVRFLAFNCNLHDMLNSYFMHSCFLIQKFSVSKFQNVDIRLIEKLNFSHNPSRCLGGKFRKKAVSKQLVNDMIGSLKLTLVTWLD